MTQVLPAANTFTLRAAANASHAVVLSRANILDIGPPCVLGLLGSRRRITTVFAAGSTKIAAPMLVAGNWKMFKGAHEARAFATRIRHLPERTRDVEVVVCPPFVSLQATLQGLGEGSLVRVYAQSVHWELEGAFTGEVSAPMLAELGVKGAIVGHSERRQHFGETDETVRRRTDAALEAGLRVIACVGETEAEREAEETESVLARQVAVLPRHERLVIAYEPVWAIGTGRTATPEIAQKAHAFIKSLHPSPVLYGGSVKPENALVLLGQPDVDGALVGHSERRHHFGETDETVRLRAEAALEAGLTVIACVGETEAEREAGETEAVLARQVGAVPRHQRLVIAYEPVWAIGTGRTATPEMAQDAHAFIKSLHSSPVLYGGSVKAENARVLLGQPDVDGALVGGASLDPVSFEAICRAGAEAVAA